MKLCLLLLLPVVIVACAPPYSAELNSSAALAHQMTLLGTFGPVNSPDGNSTTAIKFLPVKPTAATIDALTVQSGFLVSENPGRESLCFAYQDSSEVQTSDFRQSFPLAGADPNYPLYEYDVIATTTTANILVFHLDAASIGNNTVQLFTAALPTGPFQSAPLTTNPQFLTSIYGSQSALAVQVLPVSSATDKFNFLLVNTGIGSEVTAALAASTSVFPTSGNTLSRSLTLPASANRFLDYRSPDDTLSYLGYNSGGQWIWSRWDGSSMLPLGGVTHRIDALLTDGDLISTQDGTLTIYDLNGTEVNSVSLGGMQFCYEAYVGTTPYVFFSLSMGFPHENWLFRVYAIPTSALRDLKG